MNNMIKIALIVFLFLSCNTIKEFTIFLVGDSTMSDKPNPEDNPERGWGQMLPQYFNEHVTVKNFAVNGRSTKSFIDEGKWDKVLTEINRGDYVFIQFGHNDQKEKDPKRYTNPMTAYRHNLEKYITDSRNKGAIPVLFSSIVRRKFNEYGTLIDTHRIYPLIVRQVAKELNVPFVDMQYKSEVLVNSLGSEISKELYLWVAPGIYSKYPEGKQDNTHFSVKGAKKMALLAIEGLKENKLDIIKYLKQSSIKR